MLAEKMGVGSLIEPSIKGVTFGLVIDAMKLIAASKNGFKQKYLELRKIVTDKFLHELVMDTNFSGASWKKKIFYNAVKYNLVFLCLLFVSLKNKRNT